MALPEERADDNVPGPTLTAFTEYRDSPAISSEATTEEDPTPPTDSIRGPIPIPTVYPLAP